MKKDIINYIKLTNDANSYWIDFTGLLIISLLISGLMGWVLLGLAVLRLVQAIRAEHIQQSLYQKIQLEEEEG